MADMEMSEAAEDGADAMKATAEDGADTTKAAVKEGAEKMKATAKESADTMKAAAKESLDLMKSNAKEGAEIMQSAMKDGAEKVKAEGATMMRLWQDNASRIMRAHERMMHGMMSALKMEIELGQDLVEHRMTTLREASQAEKPLTAGQTMLDRYMQEMERLTSTMREVSEEMRKSFGEAAKMMFHDATEAETKAEAEV